MARGRIPLTFALSALLSATGCPKEKPQPDKAEKPREPSASTGSVPGATPPASMVLLSEAFADGQRIPKRHAYRPEGQNVSPALSWSGVPAGTKELALLLEDPDAPDAVFVHWVLYKLPAATVRLKEGIPFPDRLDEIGAIQGKNDFDESGYGGPMPPPGKVHRYIFTLYALDAELEAKPGRRADDLRASMKGHVLAEAKLTGTYRR